MNIECVTVCKDYGDILNVIAPYNRPLLHRWLVITSPDDALTKSVCRKHSIECMTTDSFNKYGSFCKACGINKGLDLLKGSDWLLQLDADVLLPYDFKQCLESSHLEPGKLYGCDRLNIIGQDNFEKQRYKGFISRTDSWIVHKNRQDTSIGSVVANIENGYTPIGFFQLWHGKETLTWNFPKKRYPELHGNAARTDVQFALQWDRRDRILLPELVVFHLESEAAPMGSNWNGRKTKPWSSPDTKAMTMPKFEEY